MVILTNSKRISEEEIGKGAWLLAEIPSFQASVGMGSVIDVWSLDSATETLFVLDGIIEIPQFRENEWWVNVTPLRESILA